MEEHIRYGATDGEISAYKLGYKLGQEHIVETLNKAIEQINQ